jgi:hypothetical protein
MFYLVFSLAIDLSGTRMQYGSDYAYYKEKTGHKGLKLSTCLVLIRI